VVNHYALKATYFVTEQDSPAEDVESVSPTETNDSTTVLSTYTAYLVHNPQAYSWYHGGRQFFGRWSHDRKRKTTWHNNFTTTSNFSSQTRTDGTSNNDMEYNARKKERQEEIDRILDKIRISGYDSLSKDEKRRLFEASHDR
jgi:hypothetical protein